MDNTLYSNWASFYNFAEDFHPTFKAELSKQLLDKISIRTKLKQFEKYNFILLVGIDEMHKQIINNKMYAYISLVTPTSLGLGVWVYWYSDAFDNLEELHKQDITNIPVVIDWNIDFPLAEVLSYTRPRRKDKKEKTGLGFDVEYFHYSFPDVSIEFYYFRKLEEEELKEFNIFLKNFYDGWNTEHEDKAINFYHLLAPTEGDNNTYIVSFDFGLNNNSKTITSLLKQYAEQLADLPTDKICIK